MAARKAASVAPRGLGCGDRPARGRAAYDSFVPSPNVPHAHRSSLSTSVRPPCKQTRAQVVVHWCGVHDFTLRHYETMSATRALRRYRWALVLVRRYVRSIASSRAARAPSAPPSLRALTVPETWPNRFSSRSWHGVARLRIVRAAKTRRATCRTTRSACAPCSSGKHARADRSAPLPSLLPL